MSAAITQSIDVTQVVLYAFWIFFALLIFYIRKEDRREGYPLEADTTGKAEPMGVIWFAKPKTFNLMHGGSTQAPNGKSDNHLRPPALARVDGTPGAPHVPTGNPLVDGVGPASYADRANVPDLTVEGHDKIVPMRVAGDFYVSKQDSDPRGMAVIGCDGEQAGEVSDIWVDRSEFMIRYLEVDLGPRTVILPFPFVDVDGAKNKVKVAAITAAQFSDVPALANPDQITLLEEDRISGYYGGGYLYATPERQEPIL